MLLSIYIDKVRRQGVQWNLAAVLAVQLAFVVTGSCFGSSTGVRCNWRRPEALDRRFEALDRCSEALDRRSEAQELQS